MIMKSFKQVTILYRDLIPVATTRFPWFHKNFSGIPGWKQEFIKDLEDKLDIKPEQKGTLKVLFKAFGRVIVLDSDHTEFWKYPKITCLETMVRAGWLYWALAISRYQIYYIPAEVKAKYMHISDEDNLHTILRQGMNTGNPEMVMGAMDIMLKFDYSNFRIQSRVISKSGDRIKYTITYPKIRVIIESVNSIPNQVLAAKYHHILSTGDMDDRKCNLLHKDDMTPEQLEWLEEVD